MLLRRFLVPILATALVCLPGWAQTTFVGPSKIVGPTTIPKASAGGGGHTFAAPAGANNHCYTSQNFGTTMNCILGAAPASGSFVTVSVFGAFSMTGMGVSDGTNSYSLTASSPSNVNDASSGSEWIAYRYETALGGATITATWTGTCSFCSISVDNFGVTGAGAVVVDVNAAGNGTTGAVINTPNIASPTAGDLLWGACASENGIASIISPWVADPNGLGAFGEDSEYILSATSSQIVTFNQSSGHWDCVGAAFK